MSNRSLIEINHDYAGEMTHSARFSELLARYLAFADRETAKELEPYGVRVIGMRHHSGKFILDGHPDGFPVTHLTPRDGYKRFPDGKLKPFLSPTQYADLRNDDQFLYNEGLKPEGLS